MISTMIDGRSFVHCSLPEVFQAIRNSIDSAERFTQFPAFAIGLLRRLASMRDSVLVVHRYIYVSSESSDKHLLQYGRCS